MKLTDLDASFITYLPRALGNADNIATAQGVWFLCPKCFTKNNGPVGTHMVLVWFKGRGVPDDATPGPGRWQVSGTGLHDLTLAPSIYLIDSKLPLDKQSGCQWHGFVRNGDAA